MYNRTWTIERDISGREGEPPEIVCLCGSTRFKLEFEKQNRLLTCQGYIVLLPGCFVHLEGIDQDSPLKKKLDEYYLWKIDLADWILIINPGFYIGEGTKREIIYARDRGKRIEFLVTENINKFLGYN